MSSELRATLTFCGAEQVVRALRAAVEVDDSDSFSCTVEQKGSEMQLIIEVRGDNLATVRATVDDLLACIAAAETSLDAISGIDQ
jgi:hypothetical protein